MADSAFYAEETPIVKLVYDALINTVKDNLEKNYFAEFGSANKWKCYSDYCYDKNKQNDILTFSFFPHIADPEALSDFIHHLAPTEIKKSSKANHEFISFIRYSPFVNFSFIVENHKNLFFSNRDLLKESILFSMNQLLNESLPSWEIGRPYLREHHLNLKKKIKMIIHSVGQDKKIRIIKNVFLTTSIGSAIATHFANRTNAEIFGWYSDRDEIFEVADGFIVDLFNIQFSGHLKNDSCKFVAALADSKSMEWYKELIKIPDFLTGALADFNFITKQITHEKFRPVIEKLISNNDRNVFVFKLNFNNKNQVTCSRVSFKI